MLTLAEAMLRKKCPRGGVESRHQQTEELSVTQSEYESAAEREYAEQETLKTCEPKQSYMAQTLKT